MNHQSSYKAPRSERTSSTGSSYTTRSHRNKKKNPYTRTSWKDNPVLRNLIFFVLPVLVINGLIFFFAVYTPKVELDIGDTTDYKSVDVTVRVHSLLPLKNSSITLDSAPLEMERDGQTYTATLTANGVVEVTAESINGMSRTVFEHVMVLDDTAPTVDEDYTLNSNFLTITVSDSLSGVNYDELYGRDEDGERVEPTSIDQETGTVVFPMSGNTITVHIEDFVGNAAEPSYSIRIEGLEEDAEENEEDSAENSEDEEDDSESTRSTTAARETTRSTTAARETTRSTTAARETTRSTTAARETTRSTTAARETTRSTTAARETTRSTTAARETTAASTTAASTTAASTTAAPSTSASTTAASTTQAQGPGVSSTTASQAAEPISPDSSGQTDTIIPLD